MMYLDYLPEIGKQTQYRFGQALAALTYFPFIRETVDNRNYVVFYYVDKNPEDVSYSVASEKVAFEYAKMHGKDCQIFKLLKSGEALAM